MQIFRSPVEVLHAIKLNDDRRFEANEITNVYADRMLPSELKPLNWRRRKRLQSRRSASVRLLRSLRAK